jgi:hypothetical protein
MHFKALGVAFALALSLSPTARAGTPVDIQILDHRTGEVLPVFWHAGERHVVGEPGREYEIRLRNQGAGRILAVTSVDGVNVITGESAAPLGSGYVLDPWARVDIDGWRKSMEQVAAFYFTALPDSYAARTGRPDNVGVIGVALFRERMPLLLEGGNYASPTAPQPAAEASADRKSSRAADSLARQDERLGTGHGRRLDSGATYTSFDRASDEPDEIIRIYYDSRKNLIARGIIPRDRFAERLPEPFPNGFVPDPR